LIEDIVWDPLYPLNGSSVSISITIRNVGNATAYSPFLLSLEAQNEFLGSVMFEDDLPAGGNRTGAIEWRPRLPGQISMLFELDVSNSVTEWREDNNAALRNMTVLDSGSLPDLCITDIWRNGSMVEYQALNKGNGTSPRKHANWSQGKDATVPSGTSSAVGAASSRSG